MKKNHFYFKKLQNWFPTIVKIYVAFMILFAFISSQFIGLTAFIFGLYWIAYPFFVVALIYAITYIVTKAFHDAHKK